MFKSLIFAFLRRLFEMQKSDIMRSSEKFVFLQSKIPFVLHVKFFMRIFDTKMFYES